MRRDPSPLRALPTLHNRMGGNEKEKVARNGGRGKKGNNLKELHVSHRWSLILDIRDFDFGGKQAESQSGGRATVFFKTSYERRGDLYRGEKKVGEVKGRSVTGQGGNLNSLSLGVEPI